MKGKILDALKAKFTGVSDTILDRVAEKLAKTVTTEEEVKTAVDGVTFQQVLESYGDSRATEAQKTAVTNYEKKYGLKNGVKTEPEPKPDPKPDPNDPNGGQGGKNKPAGGDDTPEWAKQLIETNKLLQERLTKIETEKQTNGRKGQLTAILAKSPESIKARYEKDFARMTFNDDDDFNAWIGEVKTDVEKINADFVKKGGVVGGPKGGNGGGNGGDEKNPYLEARIKERSAAVVTPAIQGLQTNKA